MRNGSSRACCSLPDPIVLLPATSARAPLRRAAIRATVLAHVLAPGCLAAGRTEAVPAITRRAGSALLVTPRAVEQPERGGLRSHGELPSAGCRSSGVSCGSGQGIPLPRPMGTPEDQSGVSACTAVRLHRPPPRWTEPEPREPGPSSRASTGIRSRAQELDGIQVQVIAASCGNHPSDRPLKFSGFSSPFTPQPSRGG